MTSSILCKCFLPPLHYISDQTILIVILLFILVRSAKVYTSSSQTYRTLHRSLLDTQETVFKVKAASDAHISLLSVPSNFKAPSYEVIIGALSNSKTVLFCKSSAGDIEFEIDTPNILSSSELRSFWLSWINGTIQFGTGDVVGQSRLLNFKDPQPTYRKYVHAVAVATGLGVNGEWEIGELFGSSEL